MFRKKFKELVDDFMQQEIIIAIYGDGSPELVKVKFNKEKPIKDILKAINKLTREVPAAYHLVFTQGTYDDFEENTSNKRSVK